MPASSRRPISIYRNEPPPRPRRVPSRLSRRRRASSRSLVFAGLLLFFSGLLLGWTIAVVGNTSAQHAPQPSRGGAPGVFPAVGAAASQLPPAAPDWITVDLLPINEWSRPGDSLEQVNGVVVHYVGNPGTTARQNRSYFGYLAETHETSASSHFLVGMDGEIIQCVPLDEIAYCSSSRNSDTISIECCHPDDTGAFTPETDAALKKLLNWLVDAYGLGREQVLRHYDVTGKECPIYYVNDPSAWDALLDSLTFPAVPLAVSLPGEQDWNLTLVNRDNPLPSDFTVPQLTQLANGHSIDSRAYPALQSMMDGARAAGYQPLICSSFRTWDAQDSLFRRKVQSYLDQGYSQADAESAAAYWVARPGTSEHQLGLAVDIVDLDYQLLDKGQEDRPVQQWLMAHCAEYGFILRYPTDKSGLTGVGYEPWHYRYVGEEAAREIMDGGLCLEEYLGNL